MNKLKRLAALALSLAMVFTMGMGVAAETPDASKHDAKIGDVGYATLKDALEKATEGQTVELLKDVTSNEELRMDTKGVTLKGGNFTLTSTASSGKAITITGDNCEVSNLNIILDNTGYRKYGVNFYDCSDGRLSGVTVNGNGSWYGVNVNSSEVSISGCTFTNCGAGVDFSIGGDVNGKPLDMPHLEISGSNSSGALVFIDDDTIDRMANLLQVNIDPDMTPAEKATAVLNELKQENASKNYLPGPVLESMTVNKDGEIGAPANGSSSNNTYTPSKKRYTELPRNWWPEIEKIQKAEAGETVEIELRGDKVSAQVIDEAAGKDVNLAVNHLWNIYTVNGKDLKSDPARVYYTAADFIKEITAVEHTVTPVEE